MKTQFRAFALFAWIALFAVILGNARAQDLLKQAKRIDLPGVEGRIDHMAVDIQSHRLFVAALGNDSVEVVDLDKASVIESLRGFAKPQGVLLAADEHELWVTNGESRNVDVYDTRSLQKRHQIELKGDNDNIRYDPNAKQVYVGCGADKDGALCVIDPARYIKVKEIALSGHPESFQLEQNGARIFVNVPTSGNIEVIDRKQGRVVAAWPVSAKKNFPMALDEEHRRLFIGTRDPAKLLVLDSTTGKTVAGFTSVGDADDIFSVAAGLIFVSGGEGFIAVFRQQDADRYEFLGQVPTTKGARTSLYVPEWKKLVLAAPKTSTAPAHVLVYAISMP